MLGSIARRPQIAPHRKAAHQRSWHLQRDGTVAERLHVDTDSGNAHRFQRPRDVSNGHVADGSARSQHRRLNPLLAQLMGPRWGKDITQPDHVGQAMKGIRGGR